MILNAAALVRMSRRAVPVRMWPMDARCRSAQHHPTVRRWNAGWQAQRGSLVDVLASDQRFGPSARLYCIPLRDGIVQDVFTVQRQVAVVVTIRFRLSVRCVCIFFAIGWVHVVFVHMLPHYSRICFLFSSSTLTYLCCWACFVSSCVWVFDSVCLSAIAPDTPSTMQRHPTRSSPASLGTTLAPSWTPKKCYWQCSIFSRYRISGLLLVLRDTATCARGRLMRPRSCSTCKTCSAGATETWCTWRSKRIASSMDKYDGHCAEGLMVVRMVSRLPNRQWGRRYPQTMLSPVLKQSSSTCE